MKEPTMETLGQRLDHLERENRRLKKAGVAALAVIAAVVLMGQAKAQKVVEAEKFVLTDGAGKVRAVLGAERQYYKAPTKSEWRVLHKTGEPARWPFVYGLHFFDTAGKYRASLSEYVGGQLFLTDERTASQVNLRVGAGVAWLEMMATVKSPQQIDREAGEDAERLEAAKPEEREKIFDEMMKDDLRSNVSLVTQVPSPLPLLPGRTNGSYLTLGEKGITRTILGRTRQRRELGTRPTSSLVLFDKKSKVIWSAP